MNILQLMVQLGIKGTDTVQKGLEGVEKQAHGAAGGVKHAGEEVEHAEAKFEHFEFAMTGAVFALQSFTAGLTEAVAVAGELSGVKIASEWAHLSDGLVAVTNSAEDARDMLKEVKEMAAKTGFNAQDFAKAAPQLVNAGIPQSEIVDQLGSMANLAAKGGLSRQDLPGFLESMVRLKDMDHPMVKQLLGMGNLPMKDLVNAAVGTHFTTANQANDFLASTGRGQGYDILLKGADAIAKDAAAMQKLNDPAMALAKTMETLEEAMEPTGELLLKVLAPVGAAFGWVAEQIEHINTVTGGSAGLVAILMLLLRHHKLLISSFRAAIRYTQELAEAVERYGAAAEFASHATAAGEVGAAAHGAEAAEAVHGAEAVRPMMKMAEALKAATTAVKVFAKNPLEAMKSVKIAEVLKVAKLAKVADVATFAVGLGMETLGDHMRGADGRQTRGGAITQGVGEGIGFGGLGFFLGPEVGAVTTLIGAIAGGIVGNNRYNAEDKEEKHTKAVEENTEALLELKGTMVGGGRRTRAAFSQMEMERGVARAMASVV